MRTEPAAPAGADDANIDLLHSARLPLTIDCRRRKAAAQCRPPRDACSETLIRTPTIARHQSRFACAAAAAGLCRAGAAAMPCRNAESRGWLQPPAPGGAAYGATRPCGDDQPAAYHRARAN